MKDYTAFCGLVKSSNGTNINLGALFLTLAHCCFYLVRKLKTQMLVKGAVLDQSEAVQKVCRVLYISFLFAYFGKMCFLPLCLRLVTVEMASKLSQPRVQ